MVVTEKIWVDMKVSLCYEIKHDEDAALESVLDLVYAKIPNLEIHMRDVISGDDRLSEMLYEVQIDQVNMIDECENVVRLE